MIHWCYEKINVFYLGSEAMEAAIKLARQVSNGFEISAMAFDNCSL